MGLLSRAKEALKKHVGGKRRRKKKQHVPRVTEDSAGRALARSVGGFLLGMMVAGLYGALVLFVQGYNIWYCLVTTISLAAGLGLGMAFSCKVRLTVLLVLPQIFSSKWLAEWTALEATSSRPRWGNSEGGGHGGGRQISQCSQGKKSHHGCLEVGGGGYFLAFRNLSGPVPLMNTV